MIYKKEFIRVYIARIDNSRRGKEFLHKIEKKLLDIAIHREFGITSTKEIVYSESGKPFFCNGFPFFNFSHSRDFLVCVVDDENIGIDIQKERRISEQLIERHLRLEQVCNNCESTIEWTKYESFSKLIGCGIPNELDYASGVFTITSDLEGYHICICSENKRFESIRLEYIVLK